MRFGIAAYAMNVQDGGDYDLAARLTALQNAGCSGIERLEANDSAELVAKAATFGQMGMEFATCRGPRPEQTLSWSCALGCKYVWLIAGDDARQCDFDEYIKRCNRFLAACKRYKLAGALHNHLGARIQNPDELDYFMQKCPEAKLLFDIGHWFGAGGDVLATAKKYYSRLAGVHLKNIYWLDQTLDREQPWQKRLYFCGLGLGNSQLDEQNYELLEFLQAKSFADMVLIEPDYHGMDLAMEMQISLDNIAKHGFKIDGRQC